ncbi:peptidase U32 family protein [Sunxiuqinia sp. A32]|uniref:peptidase U32 family protein n=1 Tax=Sunxiuqinia sp. A32 TaxID=3461496 RepID=UPI00404576B6
MGKKKPEILLPAGNTESFFAALKGGADAIYLGLRSFNARGRASNFTESQLLAAIKEVKKKNAKIYVTLNTVIKNNELEALLDVLAFLEKAQVDAIIIQDWGVYWLAKNQFPGLVVHASTQMGNHNSLGVSLSERLGISRVILARELTMKELEGIAGKAKVELELFVHGALCYSFSGLCFFSSYIGGRGANRGLCAQPCRRIYKDDQDCKFLFNLKDNQQLSNVDRLKELGISSLKIEGRMKSADYVYQVAKAYRLAVDQPNRQKEAEEMLRLDFGRAKISYFLGKDVKEGIAENSNTGISIGFVKDVKKGLISLNSNTEMQDGDRIRIRNVKNDSTVNLKLRDFQVEGDSITFQFEGKEKINVGDEIFWVGRRGEHFPSKFDQLPKMNVKPLPFGQKKAIRQKLIIKSRPSKPRLFVRVDDPDWLRKLRLDDVDGLVLSFTRKDLEKFDFNARFIQQNKQKIYVELPKFISEEHIDEYRKIIQRIERTGYTRFFVSHLSQKLLLGKDSQVSSNEHVYVYNDAAAKLLQQQQMRNFCYPMENDFENLKSMQNKQGIVLLHGYPELFYSRMPVSVSDEENQFKDDHGKTYQKTNKDGITIVVPDAPVNLFQYKKQIMALGFSNFMIDLSHEKTSKNILKRLLTKYRFGEQYQPSSTFNFKKGLF